MDNTYGIDRKKNNKYSNGLAEERLNESANAFAAICTFILLNTVKLTLFNYFLMPSKTLGTLVYKLIYTLLADIVLYSLLFRFRSKLPYLLLYIVQSVYIFANISYNSYFGGYLHLFQASALFTEGLGPIRHFTIPVNFKMLVILFDLPLFIKILLNYGKYVETLSSGEYYRKFRRVAIYFPLIIFLGVECLNFYKGCSLIQLNRNFFSSEGKIIERYGTLINNISDITVNYGGENLIKHFKYGKSVTTSADANENADNVENANDNANVNAGNAGNANGNVNENVGNVNQNAGSGNGNADNANGNAGNANGNADMPNQNADNVNGNAGNASENAGNANQNTGEIQQKPNFVLIQVESMDAAIINQKYNGNYVTPYLNSLTENSIYYRYTMSYHKSGGTSDCEFSAINSIEPLTTYPSIKIPKYDYPNSFIKKLTAGGYSTAAFHGNIGNYYNRDVAFEKMGFDVFYDIDKMGFEESGWGAPDHEVFNFALNYLDNLNKPKAQGNPFLAYIITMSSHMPFNFTEEYYSNSSYDSIEDETVRNYFISMSYVDGAIENFVKEIQARHPNTYILIWGDHTPGINSESYKQASYTEENDYFEFVPMFIITPDGKTGVGDRSVASFLDIAPTVLNASGIECTYKTDGINLLDPPADLPAIPFKEKTYGRAELYENIVNNMEN